MCISQCVRGQSGCRTARLSSWSGCCWGQCSEEPSLTGITISENNKQHKKTKKQTPSLLCLFRHLPCFVLFFCGCRYGKRPMLLVCLCMQAVCGPAPAALPHPLFFLALRCLTGLCCCCINISSFSLGNHTHRNKWG